MIILTKNTNFHKKSLQRINLKRNTSVFETSNWKFMTEMIIYSYTKSRTTKTIHKWPDLKLPHQKKKLIPYLYFTIGIHWWMLALIQI